MKKICDFIRKWKSVNITIKRTNIAGAIIMFMLIMTLYMYMEQEWGQYLLNFEADPWLILAAILSGLLAVEFKIPESWRHFWGTILMFIAPAIAFWGMEFIHDNKISEMRFVTVAVNYLAYLLVYLVLYILFNRIWIAITLGNAICFFYIVLNYYVLEFRGTPIRAYDLLAVRTAMGVAGQYEIELNLQMAMLLLYFTVCSLCAMHVRWKEKSIRNRLIVDTVLMSVLIYLISNYFNVEFIEKYDLKPDPWEIEISAKEHGMMGDFVAGIPYLKVEKPESYSPENAANMQAERASQIEDISAEEDIKPDVIAIMNESFSDLGVLGDIQTSEDCLEYFYSLSDNVVRGQLYVPIRGGTTCNSEFEFITGYSCAFLPNNTVAFQNVIKDDTYNLGRDFGEAGYSTTYFHPYYAKGWNRNNVYQSFGFDSAIFLEDIIVTEDDIVKMYMTDEADYRNLIQLYETQKKTNENVFMFNVTMQNHGGYAWGMSEVDVLSPEGENAEAEEYFSLINRSDEAFEQLIEYYSNVETPVVILMFGDHQPTLSEFTQRLQEGTASDDIAGKMEEYCVPFIIWANYDIEEKYYDGISANYLSVVLKETVGQPLTEYQKYLKSLMIEYPVITNRAVKDAEGNWYTLDEAMQFEGINEYNQVQYWNLVDSCK